MGRLREEGIPEGTVFNENMDAINRADPLKHYINQTVEEALGISYEDVVADEMANVSTARAVADASTRTTLGTSYASLTMKAQRKLADAGLAMGRESLRVLWNEAVTYVRVQNGLGPEDPVPGTQIEEAMNRIVDVMISKAATQ